MKPGKLLSSRIKELREAAELSQQELATRADLSVSQIAKLEQGAKGNPRLSTVLALAAALGVKPGQLLDDLPYPPSEQESSNGTARKSKKGKKKERKEKKVKAKKKKIAVLVPTPAGNGHREEDAG